MAAARRPNVPVHEAVGQERLDAEARALREMAMSMLAKGQAEDAVDVLVRAVRSLQQDNARLVRRLAAATRARFGRSSEKLSAEELKQLVLAFGATDEQAAAADPLVPVPKPPVEQGGDHPVEQRPKKKRPNHPGREQLSPTLPRTIELVKVPAEERKCLHCGTEMTCIDHIDTETVEFIPARIEVKVERREKLACTACKQDIVSAPRVSTQPYQRRAGASLFAHLVESKCDDALPVYRQQDQLRRLGFDIPLNSLYGYWDHATTLLQPVADVIVSTILGDPIVGLDDTKLDFLDPGDPRGKRRGHLWCFVGCVPVPPTPSPNGHGATPRSWVRRRHGKQSTSNAPLGGAVEEADHRLASLGAKRGAVRRRARAARHYAPVVALESRAQSEHTRADADLAAPRRRRDVARWRHGE